MASLGNDGTPSEENGRDGTSQIVNQIGSLPAARPPMMPVPPSQAQLLALQINQMQQCGQMGVVNQLSLQWQLQRQRQLQWQQQQQTVSVLEDQRRPLKLPPARKRKRPKPDNEKCLVEYLKLPGLAQLRTFVRGKKYPDSVRYFIMRFLDSERPVRRLILKWQASTAQI